MRLLASHQIDVVFDIGANVGVLRTRVAESGLSWTDRLVRNPLPQAFSRLVQEAARDPAWEPVQMAIGDRNGDVSLPYCRQFGRAARSCRCCRPIWHPPPAPPTSMTLVVAMTTLYRAIDRHLRPGERLFVKVDAQGYEDRILTSADRGSSGSAASSWNSPLCCSTPARPRSLTWFSRGRVARLHADGCRTGLRRPSVGAAPPARRAVLPYHRGARCAGARARSIHGEVRAE